MMITPRARKRWSRNYTTTTYLIHTRDNQLILSIVTVLSRQRPGQGKGLCPWGLKGHWGMGEPREHNRNNRVTKQ